MRGTPGDYPFHVGVTEAGDGEDRAAVERAVLTGETQEQTLEAAAEPGRKEQDQGKLDQRPGRDGLAGDGEQGAVERVPGKLSQPRRVRGSAHGQLRLQAGMSRK